MNREEYLNALKEISNRRAHWDVVNLVEDNADDLIERELELLRTEVCSTPEEYEIVSRYVQRNFSKVRPGITKEDENQYAKDMSSMIFEKYKDQPIPDDEEVIENFSQEELDIHGIGDVPIYWFIDGKKFTQQEFLEYVLNISKENKV